MQSEDLTPTGPTRWTLLNTRRPFALVRDTLTLVDLKRRLVIFSMKNIVSKAILLLARKIIQKYQPTVVAITGSVGKTSTKEAVATVLRPDHRLRASEGNYNNAFGVPLTIIGCPSPGRSVIGWLLVLWRGVAQWLFTNKAYPSLLVLEFGIDHPGDMDVLCQIAAPDVAVLTRISAVHVAQFDSLEALAQEKAKILSYVKKQGAVILNADDARVLANKERYDQAVTYGLSEGADVRAQALTLETRQDFSFEPEEMVASLSFEVAYQKDRAQVVLTNQLGQAQVSCVLAAMAVGRKFGLSLEVMAKRLEALVPAPGRMRPLAGIKGCLLLDDSYNAAPASMQAALDVLIAFEPVSGAKRIAVLGSMAELGNLTEQEHRFIGMRVAELGIDILMTVGEQATIIRRAAIEAGMDEMHTHQFATSAQAGRELDRLVKSGDIVLIKGSQSMRMERVTKDLMAEPLRAHELLVRQSAAWQDS